jgi:four helix bundle protein
MYIESFKQLTVWQKSIELVKEAYLLTAQLPREEIYGLTSQMRRSAISIPSNIAEGKKRNTKNDFLQFLRIADGSAAELETQIILVKDLYPVCKTEKAESLLNEVQRMLITIIKKLETPKS